MGEYVNAGGLRTYYEVRGEGEPLVLLHGGLATTESWSMQVPTLAKRYRVYVPERRGHGRTPDVAGPITFDTMAADTAAFLEAAGTGPARLVGWSDGAVVGMLVALRRPELVCKLVAIGQYFNLDGEVPAFRAMIEQWSYSLPGELHEVYDRVSPDGPEHFPVVLEKMMRMWREEPDAQLAVIPGGSDVVPLEKPDLVNRLILDFLSDQQPEKMMSLRG